MRPYLLIIVIALSVAGCTKHVGKLNVINHADKPLKGTLDGRDFTVRPDRAWAAKDIAVGDHDLVIGKETLTVAITEHLTTVVDLAGASCYVVADFQRQYGKNPQADVRVVERFEKQKMFTPKNELLVSYGRKLPSEIAEGTQALRLHHVDCDSVKDKNAISKAIMRIP